MSTETFSLADLEFTPTGLAVGDEVADLLFREARTVNTFADTEVTDEQVRAVHDVVRWGPTMMNTVPMRLLLVRSPEARARLAAHMAPGNRDRVLAAPLTIVVAADRDFHEHLDVLVPHLPDAREKFADPDARETVARSSATLQAGYLIVGPACRRAARRARWAAWTRPGSTPSSSPTTAGARSWCSTSARRPARSRPVRARRGSSSTRWPRSSDPGDPAGDAPQRRAQPGSGPTAAGRSGSADHCDHDPGYSAAGTPIAASAATSWAAVTPEPQYTAVGASR